jgi:hypothetical protein
MHLDRYLKDDVNGFSSTLDICFMLVIYAHLLACTSSVLCLPVDMSVPKYKRLSYFLLFFMYLYLYASTHWTLCLYYLSLTSYLTAVDFCTDFHHAVHRVCYCICLIYPIIVWLPTLDACSLPTCPMTFLPGCYDQWLLTVQYVIPLYNCPKFLYYV